MAIVTREVLIAALENVFGSKGMDRGDIEELSDFVLSFFGYEDYVLDNVLTSAERDIFYNLEECGLLNAHREEVNIAKGKAWRVNQWTYNKNNIDKAASNDAPAEPEKNPYDEYFKEIDQNGS